MKYAVYMLSVIFLTACSGEQKQNSTNTQDSQSIEIYGNTQGTTYGIIINDEIEIDKDEVDDVLSEFDKALSSYIPNSILTELNNAPAGNFVYSDTHNYFNRCYQLSQEVFHLTDGYFEPTIYPLVDGWGFMKNVEQVPDSSVVDSLRALLGFGDGYHFTFLMQEIEGDTLPKNTIFKRTPQAKLDFNAIAQGLAVDVIAELIESKGGKNYFVEIGGEIRVKGKNKDGVFWRIGIDKPIENSSAETREIYEIVELDNLSIATSGSYRKFYEKGGQKYSHTLNPKTGYPVSHNLLSVSVVAENCALADALATAFMVMGVDKTKEFVKSHPDLNIEVYLIFNNSKNRLETFYTAGMAEMITE
ncbi:FAD:protein FMN transferase [Paracrocinitomix mangrovi]|uniref:FAD:protein FMN transferase n=1 Tax=Paracrocinitomix mangrovi TaxID=2862509 RepID=UPI001C8E97B2|nr:FAD:protein FMN transferase [Paracrocinitomix mangrovi]UKN01320.1 FAD:protein FMN transferase [Paracrocinitomix mangrovi]